MPYFLVKDAGPFGGSPETAREVYRTRAEAQAGLKFHRGRWRVVYAATMLDAEKQAAGSPQRRLTAFA